MKIFSSNDIRNIYLNFFVSKFHFIEKSSSLIPKDDNTLLWINSGVATMKKYFNGLLIPKHKRIVKIQKAIRTNDIKNVGKTKYHQTMFEMLGNFSIGDYFKKDAIIWAWEFLTSKKWLYLDSSRIFVTFFYKDIETKKIWKNDIGLKNSHIIEMKENFWDIGYGPCGPDTEIFYYRGKKKNDNKYIKFDSKSDMFVEIWNLVFSEFDHKINNKYILLPNKNIDTGMGLERIVTIIQNKNTNFETDLFFPIIKFIETICEFKYNNNNNLKNISFRIIADHIRTVVFAIYDGVLPSNSGRGYILRKLIRRAIIYARNLNIKKIFLNKLVNVINFMFKDTYLKISDKLDFIINIIFFEEKNFINTLNIGLNKFEKIILKFKKEKKKIDGKLIFKIYDTFGFPLELIKEIAKNNNIEIDLKIFNIELEKQKKRSKKINNSLIYNNNFDYKIIYKELKNKIKFIDYKNILCKSKLLYIIYNEKKYNFINENKKVKLIFEKTVFLSSIGGQISDSGTILDYFNNIIGYVYNVINNNGVIIHEVDLKKKIKIFEKYILKINNIKRKLISRNHTATHLLNYVLKKEINSNIYQMGSYISDKYLRFDFNNFKDIYLINIKNIEEEINKIILKSYYVEKFDITLEKAKKMNIVMFSNKKYNKIVKVIKIGDFSLELCAGTHVKNVNEIGIFKIISIKNIGFGISRIEAITSNEVFYFVSKMEKDIKEIFKNLDISTFNNINKKIIKFKKNISKFKNENNLLMNEIIKYKINEFKKKVFFIKNISYIISNIKYFYNKNFLLKLIDNWKKYKISNILILGYNINKIYIEILIVFDEKIIKKFELNANFFVESFKKYVDGKGGGNKKIAKLVFKNIFSIENILDRLKNIILKKIYEKI